MPRRRGWAVADEIPQPADGAQESEKAPKSKVYSVRFKSELARRLDEKSEPHGGHTPVITQLVERWVADGAPFPPVSRPVLDLDALVARIEDTVVTHVQMALVLILASRSYNRPLSEEEARQLVAEAYLSDALRARREGGHD